MFRIVHKINRIQTLITLQTIQKYVILKIIGLTAPINTLKIKGNGLWMRNMIQ